MTVVVSDGERDTMSMHVWRWCYCACTLPLMLHSPHEVAPFQCTVCFVSQVVLLHQEEGHRTGRPHRTLSYNKLPTSAAEQ